MKVIGIVNQKGGVGKTATAAALADGIARRGKKVLAIDFDPQGQLSASFGVRGSDVFNPPALKLLGIGGELVFERFSLSPYLDIVPAAIGLESANIALVGKVGRENFLKKALRKLENMYDYVVIDSNPSLSIITLNVMAASTDVIVPFKPEFQSLNGIELLLNTISELKEFNCNLRLCGFLATLADKRRSSTSQVIDLVRDFAQETESRVFDSVIRISVAAADAPSYGKALYAYSPRSEVCKDYEKFVDEVLAITEA